MVFILSNELDSEISGARALERYRAYVRKHQAAFPPSAFTLAVSDWYHDFSDHRCPHDARLQEVVVHSPAVGSKSSDPLHHLEILLRGPYEDGRIQFQYPSVFRYSLAVDRASPTLDWRYDEFRLTDDGHVIHEIEWWDTAQRGRWVIEASDVFFEWIPTR